MSLNSVNKYSIGNTQYHCKVCNIWVARNKKSITHHETGNRHRYNVNKVLRDAKKKKETESRNQQYIDRELQRLSGVNSGTVVTHSKPPPPMEPPVLPLIGTDEEYLVNTDQIIGQYDIDGVLYLEGNWHVDMLNSGRHCEVVPNLDDASWQPAVILSKYDDGSLAVKLHSGEVMQLLSDEVRIPAPSAPVRHASQPVVEQVHIEDEGDAYSTFNPFGGSYKGFDMTEGPAQVESASKTILSINIDDPPNGAETSQNVKIQPEFENSEPIIKFKKRRKR